MKHIYKSFGGTTVLQDAQFTLGEAEVHALMGENGAGKSTLMKILTGLYERDKGDIFVDENPVFYKSIQDAEKAGIVFIHQELNVLYDLTVEDNMFIGKELKNRFGFCDDKKMAELTFEALDLLGVFINPKAKMSELSVGQQQMVEIAKALRANAKVIIMDEPTAALTQTETAILFKVIKNLKNQGVSIVYISHRMEEIFEICDKVSVLRDGTYIDTKKISETSIDDIVKMMIGREIGERFPKRASSIGEVLFSAHSLSSAPYFYDVSFDVHRGEVLGVAGLMGAGRTEIMKALFGVLPLTSGYFELDNKKIRRTTPSKSAILGIGYITEDRKQEGLMLLKSIRENIALPNLDEISIGQFFVQNNKENALSINSIKKLHIKCVDSEQLCNNLSGGNQQKVVFAKWLQKKPRVLILDEPTRGVDVGAKKEIYSIINELASRGVAIIMVSSELPEVLGMSDRIMVISEGKLAGILSKQDATQENIMMLATGGDDYAVKKATS